ncbi:MAG TPA: ATP-binding protein [Ktedonobacterales bacterium]
MTASLFTDSLATVTSDDVQAFLDLDQEEGPRIDYKAVDSTNRTGLPETMYRAVCAFANTYGGLIVIGVSVDDKTNRPAKREGIPLRQGLEEAITSKCQSLIFPPLAPEVRVCPFKSDETLPEADRAFVVVRVSASLSTPHQMQKDNRILVRVGSECRDPDLATLRTLFDRELGQERRVESVAVRLQEGARSVNSRKMVTDS